MTQGQPQTVAPETADITRTSRRSKPAGRSAPQTKKQQLVKLLSGKAGADVATISTKLGWQQHTTRAALTGLRKAGYDLTAEKADGKVSRYHITGLPAKAEEA